MPTYKYITCLWCRQSVKRQVRGTKDARLYCSRDCSFASSSNLKRERDSIKRIVTKQRKRAAKAIKKAEHAQRELDRLDRIDNKLNCVCHVCSSPFRQATHLGMREKYCDSCAKYVAAESKRKSGRIAKSRRRARIRNTKNDPIDPYDVFDAADWSCYICGKKTPKSLRGTLDNRAPELDHVIPLSKGGTHTMDNVACCCRKCNNIKGDDAPHPSGWGSTSAGSPVSPTPKTLFCER